MSTDAAASALPLHHSFVGGREVEGHAGRRPATSPADGTAIGEATLLDAEQARAAIAAARAAFPAWRRTPIAERARALDRLRAAVLEEADGIARLVEREQGKPAVEAHAAEVLPALESLKHLARHAEDALRDEELEPELLLLAHKDARVVYEPWGVVLVITPWNYPFGLPLPIVATALVAGNTVVLKPAPSTTLTGLRIGALAQRAGLPPGVLNVAAVDDDVAARLVSDPGVGKIVFTGSVATGKRIMAAAAENLTPVLLELGGKDPAIVCADADLDRAARGVVWGAFMNAGQTCASVERVYVERPAAEALIQRVLAGARELRLQRPGAQVAEVGPLTLERQRRIVEAHVDDARSKGAKVLVGGETPGPPGFFYPPTVLVDVDHSMLVMREETFGPVLPVMVVDSLDDAIRFANDSPFGLTASGWTRSRETAARLQRELQAGVVSINDCLSSFGEPGAPWGGFRRSGIGRTHGRPGLREMVQPKYVTLDRGRGPEAWWFPYDEAYWRLLSALNPALHARSLWVRLRRQLEVARYGRLWRRFGLWRLLRGIDKLFD